MRKSLLVLALTAMVLMLPIGAFADSMDLGSGLTATASLSTNGNTFSGSITFTAPNGTTASVDNWSLQLFNPGAVASVTFTPSLPSTWSFTMNNNGSNGQNNCNGGASGWLCASDDGVIANALTFGSAGYTFSFDGTFTGTPMTVLDLQASGCPSVGTCGDKDNQGQWAVSGRMTPGTSTPEPASLALLSAGLFGLGGLIRRRK